MNTLPKSLFLTVIPLSLFAVAAGAQNPFQTTVQDSVTIRSVLTPHRGGSQTDRITSTFSIPRHDPSKGPLRSVSLRLEMTSRARFLALMNGDYPFAGVNANMRVRPRVTASGAAAFGTEVFHNQTWNLGNPPLRVLTRDYPARSAASGPQPVGSASLSLYSGSGNLSIRAITEFIQNSFISRGSMQRTFFTYDGVGSTVLTLKVTYDYTPSATATLLGSGCGGSSGTPTISASGLPTLGNAGFGVGLGGARVNAAALLLLGDRQDLSLPRNCTLYPAATGVTLFVTTSSTGGAMLNLPIPSSSQLLGLGAVGQWVIDDPSGVPVLGIGPFTLSQGLEMKIGT